MPTAPHNPAAATRPPRVLLSHGDPVASLNLGDIAMVANVVRKLQEAMPGVEIRALGEEPPVAWKIPGVQYLPGGGEIFSHPYKGVLDLPTRVVQRLRLNRFFPHIKLRRAMAECFLVSRLLEGRWRDRCRELAGLLDQFRWADVLVETGHGGFNDLFFEPNIADKLFFIRLAKRLGKPVVLTAHGYGPFNNRAIYKKFKRSLEGVSFIGSRADSGLTWETLKGFGFKSPTPVYTGDDAADLPNAPAERIDQILQAEGAPADKPLIAVHIRAKRAGGGPNEALKVAAMLDRVVDELDHHLVFVSTLNKAIRSDQMACREVYDYMKRQNRATLLRQDYLSGEVRGVIGRCDMGIGMGYHFAVFCLNQGLPCMIFSSSDYYDGKVGGMFHHFGCRDWLRPFSELTSQEPIALLKRGLTDTELRARIRAGAEDWKRRTLLPIQAIARLAGVNPPPPGAAP